MLIYLSLCQSIAILRYIGFKYHLDGETTMEKNRVNLIEREVSDLMAEFFQLAQRPNYDDLSYDYLEILEKVKLANVTKFLGKGPFINGEKVSISDFLLYEYLVIMRLFVPSTLWEKFAALEAFIQNIEKLPKIKEYKAANKPLIFSGSPKYFWNASY